MRSPISLGASWLCLFLTASALPAPGPSSCISEISLPTITLRPSKGIYENVYTRQYQDLSSQSLTIVAYTFTQTCSTINCPIPLETAPPSGFTQAVVADGSLTATLIFPTESLAAYSVAGYTVKPVHTAAPTQSNSPIGATPASSPSRNSGTSSNNGNKIPIYFDRNKPTSSVGAFTPLLSPSSTSGILTLDPSTSGLPTFDDPLNKDNSGSNGQQFVVVDAAHAQKPDIVMFILIISTSIFTGIVM
ncbi:hypothetical protein FMUND_11773 [Fusarium mundagurra]|uniref:Uncharacterized protein n=1 Tax=Fusarium mundagurra TaxID=1567541 RepID=A0A8H5Y7B4_9HYPO|nr:hypothetical protein FMUND_11773 [Fusarium mundagurra]